LETKNGFSGVETTLKEVSGECVRINWRNKQVLRSTPRKKGCTGQRVWNEISKTCLPFEFMGSRIKKMQR
jgi:hypothetical protein